MNPEKKQKTWLNPELPIEQRVADLLAAMTLEEKVLQMKHDAPAIERLGVAEHNWWNECLHGVARAGLATVFPQAIGLAAIWNEDAMFDIATIISDEARAKHHEALRNNDYGIYKGLTYWSPNINIFRDPRWGRGQETYGEDPHLTGRMGVAFIKALQGDDPKYLKVVATPKHFAVHSGPEPDRHHFDAKTNERDLRETYLPAFRTTVKEAQAWSVMGAYNRYLGEACCASMLLLQQILRDEWGFHGYVVSDCGAISDIFATHKIVKDEAEAAALAVKSGCDLNCGGIYPHLKAAVERQLITEAEIDVALTRLFLARFKLGMFDPDEIVPYAQIPYTVVDSPQHQAAALKASQESMVLLKNENATLPLSPKLKKIAVLGPNADLAEVMYGNYNGFPSKGTTPLKGIQKAVSPETEVVYYQGCGYADWDFELEPIPSAALRPNGVEWPESGLRGEYFLNAELAGDPALVKVDAAVNFALNPDFPPRELKSERFSVRWTGTLTVPETGEYWLGVTGDDGFKLYLDEQIIAESWYGKEGNIKRKQVQLDATREYKIKLEYFQGGGDWIINLAWAKVSADHIKKAVALVKDADVAVFCGGLSPRLEGEEMPIDIDGFHRGDRTSLELPKAQLELLQALHATGTPVILVLMNGSALAINWEADNLPAILEAWYPGQAGGTAIANILFGEYNPAGRLPVTFYKSVGQLPPFENYDMAGRTYRYFEGQPLFPFGFGLSFTNFSYSELSVGKQTISAGETQTVSVTATNSGQMAGDEVVQLYLSFDNAAVPVPIRSLKGFRRIHLAPGESQRVNFELEPRAMSLIDENMDRVVVPGKIKLAVGGKQPGFTGTADAATTEVVFTEFEIADKLTLEP